MSFFDKQNLVTTHTLEESLILDFQYKYGLYYLYYRIASNGGPILITEDFKNITSYRPNVNKTLQDNIVVLNQDGTLICEIPKDFKLLVGIEFTKDEKILVVMKNGIYVLYNPYQEITDPQSKKILDGQTQEIPYRVFFDPNTSPQNQDYQIQFIQTNGDSFIFVTKQNYIFLVYNLEDENPQRKLLFLEGKNLNFNYKNFSEKMIAYYLDFDKVTYVIYIACLDQGILQVKFNKNTNTLKFTEIGQQIKGKPLELLLSKDEQQKRTMAIISGYETESDLGTGYELNRINVIVISNDKIENHSCSELKLTNEEKNDYQGLYWFGNKAVIIGFRKTFKIFTNRDLFVMNSKEGLTRGNFRLFFSSEIDGIKIIGVGRDQKANLFMIRNTPIEYVYVKQEDVSLSPVKKLNECYQSYQEGKCPKEMEIIDNNNEIQQALKELRMVIYFEMEKNEQKQYLQAISFGKLFLNGDKNLSQKFKKFVLDIAVNLKVYWTIKEKTGRQMTFSQFENLLKYNEDIFVQILINKREFQCAFNLFHNKNFTKNYEKIFREYTKVLLMKMKQIKREIPSSNQDDLQQKCAEKIIQSYDKCVEMSQKIDSNILIDLANLAQQQGMTLIADKLLEKDNPIIVKIQTYLKMNMLQKAFQQALVAQNSNALYLAFDKLSQKGDDKLFNEIKETESMIQEHFYRFLKLKNKQKLQEIPNPYQYFIYNLEDNENLKNFKLTIKKAHELDKKNQIFIFAKIFIDQIQYYQETPSYKEMNNFSSDLTTYDIIKCEFNQNKSSYLTGKIQYSTDAKIKQLQKTFTIDNDQILDEKQLAIYQLKYLLENDAELNIISSFISLHKKKFSVFQLWMLFNKYNKKDILGDVLSNLDFSPSFEQCLERKLIYEACKLAIAHKQREKFDSIISQIKPEELRKKLEMEFKQ